MSSRKKAPSRKKPAFSEFEYVLPPRQDGMPQFEVGDVPKKQLDDSVALCLRKYTPIGVEELLKCKTLPEHEKHMLFMKSMKDAINDHKEALKKAVAKCKDAVMDEKISKSLFTYKMLSLEFDNAIKRMKSAGERRFEKGGEVAALGDVPAGVGVGFQVIGNVSPDVTPPPAGVGGGVQVLGIVVPGVVQEVQPPPPTNPHPDDVKVVHKRKYEPNFGDSMEEGTYKASLDELGMFEYLTKKFAHKADLEKEDKIRKLDAAVQEQKMASQEVEQNKVQVSAAEVAVVESKAKLEEAKRLLSVADSNLKKAKNSLEYQQLLM